MRRFIVRHPLTFLASVLGGVVAAAGLGALALGAGAPVLPLLYTELGLYVLVPFAVVFGVPEREGGAVAMAISAALPLLTFFAWLQHQSVGNLAAGFGLLAGGASIILAAVHWLSPREELGRAPVSTLTVPAGRQRPVARSARV